ncbi:YybH family protein [Filimonas effusa]|uniref:DUF4440 domain-containing protein n=1 Tax=Filimonas effusa TaxID=2508721 RepID=A0A4Q1D8Z7_9BACT|nr:DUF4440 domain-containing protein [Filimonas effusa]RXK85278.1 DUF4440 domain-containing protein [Filimonas effusa]
MKMSYSQEKVPGVADTIIAMEKAALEKWNHGDPSGYLDISAKDVTYFDPFLESRLDGLDKLQKYYEPMKGQVQVTRYEMLHPQVTATSEMAVLTFDLTSYEGEKVHKWHCSEVYRLEADKHWKIVQTHWSPRK